MKVPDRENGMCCCNSIHRQSVCSIVAMFRFSESGLGSLRESIAERNIREEYDNAGGYRAKEGTHGVDS